MELHILVGKGQVQKPWVWISRDVPASQGRHLLDTHRARLQPRNGQVLLGDFSLLCTHDT